MIQYGRDGRPVIVEGQDDPRYTVSLYLIRQDRPKYWNFYCIYCGKKVCELNGTVVYMADISQEGVTSSGVGAARIRCGSRTCNGRAWYSFQF